MSRPKFISCHVLKRVDVFALSTQSAQGMTSVAAPLIAATVNLQANVRGMVFIAMSEKPAARQPLPQVQLSILYAISLLATKKQSSPLGNA